MRSAPDATGAVERAAGGHPRPSATHHREREGLTVKITSVLPERRIGCLPKGF